VILLLKDERAARAWTERLLRLGADVKPARALRGGAALRISGAPPQVASEASSDVSVLEVLDSGPEARLATGEPRPVELAPGLRLGAGEPLVLAAGPCAVEDEASLDRTAETLARLGVPLLRAGAFKPRTSPYAFRGLGARGLEILSRVARRHGLLSVTEVLAVEDVPRVAEVADVLQIGARSMQSFPLLEAAGRSGRPVLLKRHPGASYEEWLLAAEYVLAAAREPSSVILCERGVRTFTPARRYTLDLGALAWGREATHLPLAVDPSHPAGCSRYVPLYAKASAAAGADLLLVECCEDPARARSDAAQQLDLEGFARLHEELQAIRPLATRARPVEAAP
jgi:3-deoxy-7-phosphoheptulonate synthase